MLLVAMPDEVLYTSAGRGHLHHNAALNPTDALEIQTAVKHSVPLPEESYQH